MQNKLNQVIIVGMDGGIESSVTAYLLKKQGLSPIGVAVTYLDNDADFKDILSCFLPDQLEHIKQICQTLEIPFYATNASELFFKNVVENIISSRLTGNYYLPNVSRVNVILNTLHSKMKQLGATAIATGHYCKILKNQSTHQLSIYQANDQAEDDSYYISKSDPEILENLIFPLSDLKQNEVEKISKLIPFDFNMDKSKRRQERMVFMSHPRLSEFVEKYAAQTLRKEGQVFNHYDGSVIGDHLGIHQFFVGQKKVPLKSRAPIDKELVVTKVFPPNGIIFMDKEKTLKFSHAFIKKFMSEKDLNRSMPMNCFAMLGPRKEPIECTVNFKNNNNLFIDFHHEIEGQLVRGQHIVFYNKKGQGAKVLGCGVVHMAGYFDQNGEFLSLPKTKSEEEEEEVVQKKKDLGF